MKNLTDDKNIWLDEPEDHDFPAAQDYLELIFKPEIAVSLANKLSEAETIIKKSKDIFRASKLSLLPLENRHVQENFKKIKANKRLSPILLVRSANELIIAVGYHRLCCSYYLTEDLDVPCRLIYVE